MKIEILHTTVAKVLPLEASLLKVNEKWIAIGGDFYEIEDYLGQERSHFKVRLITGLWYFFCGHSRLIKNTIEGLPKIWLEVDYKSQIDNLNNPNGSCNVTAIAMVLSFLGCRPSSSKQLEDELYEYCLNKGLDRHSPHDLAELCRLWGYRDNFVSNSSIEELKDWIMTMRIPVVIHGYFTGYGHIITVTGFDQKGLIVHDPYGEWYPSGYRTDLSGAYLHYSYNLIRRLCIPDGDFWVHYISL
ncbi:MAG: C39 family peptidase [Oscillatoriales cyanobacterium RM1_1_9]|nr:C39 family peptidase [Oscillatoriales cyanobacterium SM2_3_0]NJO46803.1 C39 family peptidase [Oscillatoriales cyanobacterium RM2_1_1]NJO71418.1 C39 family peptidase [Oscillatoriales cyanobacterium RM1_1_9]